jgi:hypothetical protein
MASIRQRILWFALAGLIGCTLAAAVPLFEPPSGSRQTTRRPVTDAVDAAAILYREMPLLLVSEHDSYTRHVSGAGIYLTAHPRSARELDRIPKAKPPDSPDWRGVLYVKSCGGSTSSLAKEAMCGGQFLDYKTFIICGDPALTGQARKVLARVGGVRPIDHAESSTHE